MTPEAEEGWRIKARGDLLSFLRWMFKARKGQIWQLGRHHHLLNAALLKVYAGQTKRLIINIPPRYSKTEFAIGFMAWCLGQWPDCEFIYSSYSGRLAAKSSWECRSIVQHPEYQRIFPGTILRDDSSAKDEWRTTAGGMVYAVGAGGTITGYGAGRMRHGFGGCFPYEQEVETNIGPVKIGDIVTKQMPVLVWSVNKKTGAKELAPVDTLWTNPANSILEITLDDGSSFRCTPNHKILTRSGWVEARRLAESLDLPERQTGFFHGLRSRFASVCGSLNGVSGMLWPCLKPRSNSAASSAMPCFPDLDLPNSGGEDAKLSSNNGTFPQIIVDLDGIASGDLCPRSPLHKRESTVANGVLHILGLCSPCKVIKAIVCGVAVKVASLIHWRSDANKGFKHKRVDVSKPNLSGNAKVHPKVSFPVRGRLNGAGGNCPPDKAKVADFIKPVGSVDRFPVSVRLIGHADTTFCLEVRCNNNFILSQSGAIVSNCIIVDDPHKADEATSEVMRENVWDWFQGTLESRTNSPETPIIVIMQRLHEDDLAGHLIAGHNGEEWEVLKLPAICADGSALWPLKHPIERLEQMRDAAPYVFSGQYMQEPSPPTGGMFETDRIEVVEAMPAGVKTVRAWDPAYTNKATSCDTAGAKLGIFDGVVYIEDITFRKTSNPDDMVVATAQVDGPDVTVLYPQDPGAGVKVLADLTKRMHGYDLRSHKPTTDKVEAWLPFASQVNGRNVRLVRGEWNRDFLNDLRMAPFGKRKDLIDAVSYGYQHLALSSQNAALEWAQSMASEVADKPGASAELLKMWKDAGLAR